jgi:hypothetical protein
MISITKNFALRIILFLSVFCFMTANTFSQIVFFGLKGGFNYSSFTGKDVPSDTKGRLGINAGGLMLFPVAEKVGIQFEINYSQEGAHIKEPITNIPNGLLSVDEHINYFAIPAMIRYNVGNQIKGFINAGFEFGYLFNNKRTTVATVASLPIDPEGYYPYKIKQNNGEFLAGGGIKFNRYFLEYRFNIGLTNIYSENIRESRNILSSLTMGIMLNDKFSKQKGYKRSKGIFR